MSNHCEMCENSWRGADCSGWSAEDFAPDWSEYPWCELRRCFLALTTRVSPDAFTQIADLLGALGDAFPELRECPHLDTDAAGNCRAGCGYNSDAAYLSSENL